MKQSSISYNGIQYYINVKIFATSAKVKYDDIDIKNFDVLLFDNIKKIQYENDISNPLLIGEIIYQDNSDSILNKFINVFNKYVNITIKKLKNANNISPSEGLDEDIGFNHTFIITDISKIKQENDVLTYSLKLVSSHWWNFNSNLVYSTHAKTSGIESPIDILSNLYKQAGLDFDKNKIVTNTQIPFISDTDECLQTAQSYLFKRTYDRNTPDMPGLIKIVYDHIVNRYFLWSLRDHSGDNYVNTIYPKLTSEELVTNTISIPIYNSYSDGLANQDPTIFDLINFDTTINQYTKIFDYVYHTYDYVTNTFSKKEVKNKNIVKSLPYISTQPLIFDKKYFEIDNMISQKEYKGPRVFNRQSSQWDENQWPYEDIEDVFLTNGIVSVNTAGDILRKTGDNTFLQIDKTDNSSLINLKGDWINTRVIHTFADNKYRNTVLLSRVNITTENINELCFQKLP